ncbi:MAG: OmpH family outer membrane protein [Alphaproteobacteria bacterium]|nr:OmpH family outer membrane protein [Alphaproteobacteria bacterium]
MTGTIPNFVHAAALVLMTVLMWPAEAQQQQQQQRPPAGAQTQQRPAPAAPAQAQPPRGPLDDATIAILNVDLILQKAKAVEGIRSQVEGFRARAQEKAVKDDDALRKEEQELARQRPVLTPQAFADREREFRGKVGAFQRRTQAVFREIDVVGNQAMDEVRKSLGQIVDELSRQRDFNIVLSRSQVVYARASLDITDDVLQRLDRALPQVRVAQPQEPKE